MDILSSNGLLYRSYTTPTSDSSVLPMDLLLVPGSYSKNRKCVVTMVTVKTWLFKLRKFQTPANSNQIWNTLDSEKAQKNISFEQVTWNFKIGIIGRIFFILLHFYMGKRGKQYDRTGKSLGNPLKMLFKKLVSGAKISFIKAQMGNLKHNYLS